jgi:hypothetical protein
MLSVPTTDPETAKPMILDFAKQVAAWENQPKHHLQSLGEARSAPQQSGAKK